MSVAISFSLGDGVVLLRETGEELLRRAVALVNALAREFGWTYLGPVDKRSSARFDVWSAPPIEGHRWRVSGATRFTLALIAGTGQLAETSVSTSSAHDPVSAHRSVLAVLRRLNSEIYGGLLSIFDETDFAATEDESALVAAFIANARLIGDVVRTLTDAGWAVADREEDEVAIVPFVVAHSSLPDEVLEAEVIEDVSFPIDAGRDDDEAHGRRHWTTLLEQFLKSRGIKPAHLARESGYSRQFLLNLRMGRIIPSLVCMARIVAALRRIARERLDTPHVFEPALVERACLRAGECRLLPPAEGAEE
jgi:hypothetical protein